MSWCLECGAVGRPEPATVTVDGDPLCKGCAIARGAEAPAFDGKFIERRMADFHKRPVETPSAPKEKDVEELCGCGRPQIHKGRCSYRRGQSAPGGGRSVQPKAEPLARRIAKTILASPDLRPVPPPVDVDPNLLDALWNALPEAQKKDALRAAIDSIL